MRGLPMQINPEKAREEFRTASQKNGGTGVKDFMDSMGLGVLVEQVNVLPSCSVILVLNF
jgi:arsenite-transporting ATPase